jgi:predicted RNA binding protein YcfA (HicA-like mRNA interferase family)
MGSRTYATDMPRRLRNWTYRDVTTFLKEHGFEFQQSLKGSHQGWVKPGETDEPNRRVEVHIPRDSYQPKTLKSMIRQSGIDEAKWIKWGGS